MSIPIPAHLSLHCRKTPERAAWLARLPDTIRTLATRWSLKLGAPFEGPHVSASWVAPATCADNSSAILKLGLPHFEADHELDGLAFGTATRPSTFSLPTTQSTLCCWNDASPATHSTLCPSPSRIS